MDLIGAPRPFRVEMDGDERSLRVAVRGELDIATAPRLHEWLRRAAEEGAPETVLDASGIDFIDSTGVGLLITHKKRAMSEGRRFVIASPSSAVLRAIAMMGLVDYLGLQS